MITVSDPESVGLSRERLGRVSQWLTEQIERERLAGASVLIARKGSVAYFEAAGHADIERKQPFNDNTIVRQYSMTKPITTVAAMMLHEEGRFQLNDPISDYLPDFADMQVWRGGDAKLDETVPAERPITVKQLMTHTSGLTYGFMHANPVDAAYRNRGMDFHRPDKDPNLAAWSRRLSELPLICQPGSAWNYSVSTDLLGHLVELWSGQDLQSFFQTRIFEPLGMTDTGFHVRPENHDRFAALYAAGLRVATPEEDGTFLTSTTLFSGGGGLVGNMGDYARFCQFLLNKGELDGVRLLGRKTVDVMRANHLPDNQDIAAMGQPTWSETTYDGIGFGLGFAVVTDPIKAQIMTSTGEHHWGGAASTCFWVDPEEELYVVFLTQFIPSSTYPIRQELRACVYQALI